MNESARTMIFVGATALVALVAFLARPMPTAPPATGSQIVEPFEVTEANSLKIVRYDPDEAKLVNFEVAKQGGRWLIPSHDGYPADAESQLQKVAALFTGLKAVGPPQTDDPEQHGYYGVLQPSSETSGDGKEYGRMITISNSSGDTLVDLIVGKAAAREDADEEAEKSTGALRFVRVAGQDPVYLAEISLDALTTRFEQWIEQDLLKLNSFDVAKLELRDYSIFPGVVQGRRRMVYQPRMDTQVAWDSAGSQWKLDKMLVYQRDGEPLEGELTEQEELNKTKLDGIKTAVDDLKIIDVERKPQVLFEALKGEKLADDDQALAELQQYGFHVMQDPDTSKLQVLGSNGGLRISMKDGVQYVLNFGDAKSAEKGDSTKLNRYLMVTAQIDESMLPKPMLEPEDEPLGPDAPKSNDDSGDKKEEDAADSDENQEELEPKAEDAGEGKGDETKGDEAPKPDDDAEKKRREAVKKENKRKLDEYHDKRKKAEGRVAELNARFNDWFYVVSDDVYKKVQLGRADIVKDRETAKEEGFGVDAFRKLETEGVEGKSSVSPPSPPSIPGFPGAGS